MTLYLKMVEDMEQRDALRHKDYVFWLKRMVQKYPNEPFYKQRLERENEKAYNDGPVSY